jgi:hypothetical protein
MSVRCIDRVLNQSIHAGTELLMLVVLADYSDDEGNSYPSVASLARKCRMSPRNANYILSALQVSGELRVMKNQGPMGTNRYRIMLDALGKAAPLKPASPLKRPSSPMKGVAGGEEAFTLKHTSATPEAGFLNPLKPASDEPSLNRQEPSGRSPEAPARRPDCPYQAIVDRYHAELPGLPRVMVLDAKGRRGKIKAFWDWVFTSKKSDGAVRATTAEEALQWIGDYFRRARSNDFVMGRVQRSKGHEAWQAGLEYLISEAGRLQVIERTREAA